MCITRGIGSSNFRSKNTRTIGQSSTNELIEAIQQWDIETVRVLLEWGVSANERDLKGVSVLHHAARTGDEEIVKTLVRNDAHISVRDLKEKSPIDYAKSCRHTAPAVKI
jgi:ankyrin repeat protein